MNTPQDFVTSFDIDQEKVLRRGAVNCGQEDYDVFGCPTCGRIYLLELEADGLFPDPHDVSKIVSTFNCGFVCISCGKEIPTGEAWVGPRARKEYRVRYDDILKSEWAWILNKRL